MSVPGLDSLPAIASGHCGLKYRQRKLKWFNGRTDVQGEGYMSGCMNSATRPNILFCISFFMDLHQKFVI